MEILNRLLVLVVLLTIPVGMLITTGRVDNLRDEIRVIERLVQEELDQDVSNIKAQITSHLEDMELDSRTIEKIKKSINANVIVAGLEEGGVSEVGLSYHDIDNLLSNILDVYPGEPTDSDLEIYNIKVREMVEDDKYNQLYTFEVNIDKDTEPLTVEYTGTVPKLMGDFLKW